MNLLIATSKGLIRYDQRSRILQKVHPELPDIYGISWTRDGNRLLAACTNGGHAVEFDDLAGYARSEVGTIFCGDHYSPGCLSAPHQIHCVDETYLLITNTGRNAVTKMRLDDFCTSSHRIDDVMWDRFDPSGQQGSHINSVFHIDDTVYIVAHNFLQGSKVYALSWPDMTVLKTWEFSVGGMHNVCPLDGRLLVCDSLNGCLVDALTGKTLWSNGGSGMTRGLAASERYLFIGDSSYATRAQRANSSGGIWMLDRETFEAIEYVALPGCGGVNEVRITDEVDYCHHRQVLKHQPVGDQFATVSPVKPNDRINRSLSQLNQEGWRVVVGKISMNKMNDYQDFEAESDVLLLVIQASAQCQPTMSGIISFDEEVKNKHASLIIDYGGPGDEQMIAGMITKRSNKTFASIWKHDQNWEELASTELQKLEKPDQIEFESQASESGQILSTRKSWLSMFRPKSKSSKSQYDVCFQKKDGLLILNVDGTNVLTVPTNTSKSCKNMSCGIRISGLGVRVQNVSNSLLDASI